MNLGKKIAELRKKNNLSQEELAEKVGVARQTISKWEIGDTTPDINQVKIISKIFNISIDELEKIVQDIDPSAEFNKTMIAEQYRQSLSIVN